MNTTFYYAFFPIPCKSRNHRDLRAIWANDSPMPPLGSHLKNMRLRRGLTQTELAHRAGVATSVITSAETGKTDAAPAWRYRTAINVLTALSAVLPLDAAEQEQFTTATKIAFIEGQPGAPGEDIVYANSLENFSQLVWELRTERGLTQQKLAQMAGVSVNVVTDAEKPGPVTITTDQAEALLRAISTKYRPDDRQERAFRRMAGIEVPESAPRRGGTWARCGTKPPSTSRPTADPHG